MSIISLKNLSFRSKAALLFLSFISSLSVFSQKTNADSAFDEIKSLQTMRGQQEALVDSLSTQLMELYSIREGLKTKIENLDKELEKAKPERMKLQQKQELTVEEKNKLNTWQKAEDKKNRFVESATELEQNYNDHMAVLDKAIALRDELDERIKKLSQTSAKK